VSGSLDDFAQDLCDEAEKASRRGRRSRTKGRVFERLVAKMLRAVWPEAKRGFQSRSGRDAPDVDGCPLWVETKHGARVNVRAAMRQALASTDGRPVVVVSREDRGEVLVTMRFEEWLAQWLDRKALEAEVERLDDHVLELGERDE
jgi:hypothetical protein